jgi:hypothetical protein
MNNCVVIDSDRVSTIVYRYVIVIAIAIYTKGYYYRLRAPAFRLDQALIPRGCLKPPCDCRNTSRRSALIP